MKTTRLTAGAAVAIIAMALTAAGCNSVFGIHEGLPLPDRCPDVLTIDDMEDGNGAICDDPTNSGGRRGNWFTVSDGTSSDLEPAPGQPFLPTKIPGGRDGSRYAARMTGSGFTGWGALMGFNLNVEGLSNEPINASGAGGVRFWMKSNVPVRIAFPLRETIPVSGGGACSDSGGTYNCDNHFGFTISAPDPGKWVEYKVPFSALAQAMRVDGQGNAVVGSAPWSPASLIGIQFNVPPLPTAFELAFDVWVDDISFYDCSNAGCVPTCTDPDFFVACPVAGTTPAGCWSMEQLGTEKDCAAVPVLDNVFSGIWGSAASDVWIVGAVSSGRAGTILHWNGVAGSVVPNGAMAPLWGVWGSGADDVWAVGDRGTILRQKDGAAWSVVSSPTTEALQSVWGSGPSDAWAVGHAGTILRWNGTTWSQVPSRTTHWLSGVWGSGPEDVWAVGYSDVDLTGVIVHWNGSGWAVVPSGAPQPLAGVWSSGRDDAWAVGYGIVHWEGVGWTAFPSPTDRLPVAVFSVWGSRRDDIWAVGQRGTIVHFDGLAWSLIASAATQAPFLVRQDLTRVWGSGPNDVWAVGDHGTVLHWNGTAWSIVPASAID